MGSYVSNLFHRVLNGIELELIYNFSIYLAPFLRYLRLKSNRAYWTSALGISEEEQDIKKLYIGFNSMPFKIP